MKFSKTKMLVEIVAETQFGPETAMQMIRTTLQNPQIPAVTHVKILSAESNFRPHEDPSETMTQVEIK